MIWLNNIFTVQTCRVNLLPTMLEKVMKNMSLIVGFILIKTVKTLMKKIDYVF